MGKSENIKRAKKLREAKKKREQAVSPNTDSGASTVVLKERVAKRGFGLRPNQSEIKYSALLEEFVGPFINGDDDFELVKKMYHFGVMAWNVSMLKDLHPEKFQEAINDVRGILPEYPDVIERLFGEMVNRKLEMFSEYKTLIMDLEIRKLPNGIDITVATTPFKAR